jgi:O-antigen/teichoic acid export membrane protein
MQRGRGYKSDLCIAAPSPLMSGTCQLQPGIPPPMNDRPEAARIILRGGGSAAAGFGVRLGARLLFLFVAGQLFGAALFGAFSLAVAVVELAVTLGGLGTKRTLFQFLDERDRGLGRPPAHIVVDAALLVALASALIAAAIMTLIALLPRSLLSANTAMAIFLLAPMIAGQALLDLFSAATRWKHLIRYEIVGRSIVEPYAGLAGTAAAYFLGYTQQGLLIGYWLGTLTALAYVLYGTRRCFGGFGLARYRARAASLLAMLRGTASNTANDFLSALFVRLDLYLVGILLGEGPAGIYGMARQVRTPIRQVRQSFDGLLTPIVAKTLAATGPVPTGRALASASRLILVIQLPAIVLLVAIGAPLLGAIGPEFVLGFWALLLLAAAESIQGAFGVGDLLFVYRKPAQGLWITAASIGIGLATGLLLIPPWGVTGAGLSVLITFAFRALHRRQALKASFGVKIPAVHSAGPLAAAAAGILAAVLIGKWTSPSALSYAAAAAAGLAAYAGTLFAWLGMTRSSLAMEGFVAGVSEPAAQP